MIAIAIAISISLALFVSLSPSFGKTTQGPRISDSDANECTSPSNLLTQGFYPKQPSTSSLPSGYKLQAIKSEFDYVSMYYSKHSLCPLPKLFEGQLPPETILVKVTKASDSTDPRGFIDTAFASKGDTFPGMKELDINGKAGYGWESFITDITLRNTDIGATRIPSGVDFYDEQYETIYSIRGFQYLDELVKIARSIP